MARLLTRQAWALPQVGLFLVVGALFGSFAAALLTISSPWGPDELARELLRLQGLAGPALVDEQSRQEILQLELSNRSSASPWGWLLAVIPVFTAAIGGVAILATIWKQLDDRAEQARQDRAERDRESQRRFADSFKTTTENLASDKPSLRASAAATLPTYLRSEYSEYQHEVLLVALAKSKRGMETDASIRRLVVRAVELALRRTLPVLLPSERGYFLDLSGCELRRIDLSGMPLDEVDIAFADLEGANLAGASLRRVQGHSVKLNGARLGSLDGRRVNLREARLRELEARGTQFHDAVCVSARFEDGDLRKAEFQRAELQEAHFRGARLAGAVFYGAELNNAFFEGADLDGAALQTIAKGARNWRKAHFDANHLDLLNALSAHAGATATSGEADLS